MRPVSCAAFPEFRWASRSPAALLLSSEKRERADSSVNCLWHRRSSQFEAAKQTALGSHTQRGEKAHWAPCKNYIMLSKELLVSKYVREPIRWPLGDCRFEFPVCRWLILCDPPSVQHSGAKSHESGNRCHVGSNGQVIYFAPNALQMI